MVQWPLWPLMRPIPQNQFYHLSMTHIVTPSVSVSWGTVMSCCCVPKIDRFLCRFSLQKVSKELKPSKTWRHSQGILLTVLTTSTIWILLLVLYIPYQLLWSPFISAAEHDKTVYRILDQAGVTLIIVLLFADSLLLVGVRKEEK